MKASEYIILTQISFPDFYFIAVIRLMYRLHKIQIEIYFLASNIYHEEMWHEPTHTHTHTHIHTHSTCMHARAHTHIKGKHELRKLLIVKLMSDCPM